MSPIPFLNRHPRADLSAFLDGELSAPAVQRIESHLAGCLACTTELTELRQTRAALRSLPQAGSPRSFALTPEMARESRHITTPSAGPSFRPLVNGLRLASGGLAAALVVVVVIAIAGGGGDSRSSRESAAIVDIESSSGASLQAGDYSRTDNEPTTPAYSSGGGGVAGGQGVGGGDGTGGGAVPTTAATQEGSLSPATTTPPSAADTRGVSQPSPLPSDTTRDEYSVNLGDKSVDGASPEANAVRQSDSDQGIGALTVIAIALAVLLTGALIGSFVLTLLARRA
jgi:hypothetical protein